jgi:3-deoxy-D-manno-octulosonate 8-phosphate phosphatase (KDO 8-P phosphatase)
MTLFNKNIKFLREQKQITHSQLAMMCNMTVDLIETIENGKIEPNLNNLISLSEALNYPPERLITNDLEKDHNLLKSFSFKLLVLDVDGVMTDAGVYYTENGDELKKFNTKDGLAIKKLTDTGKYVGFITSGKNTKIVENRAKLLGVQKVFIGSWQKPDVIQSWCEELKIDFRNVAYIGDDINDLPAIQKAGLSACPSDAVDSVKKAVHIVLSNKGGEGCVREFIDTYIMEVK